jgi:hypothetical protein
MNVKVNQLENTKPSKGLLALLTIAVLLTLWTLLQSDDTETTDVIELANERVSTNIKTSTSPDVVEQFSQTDVSSIAGNSIALNSLKREPLATKPYNLFKVHSWVVVPPVKKVKPKPPPPPAAPPAPFTYMGKLEDTPKNTQIFLVANGKLYSTRQGQNIDQQWRLDAEEANALRLTYLPLNLPQVLSKSAKPLPVAVPVAEANL